MTNKNNHIFIISEKKFSNTNEIIKKICKDFLAHTDEKELYYKKIDNNNYYDYIEYDLYLEDIKIEEIRELKRKFYSISLENAGYKFYVIRNIELLSPIAANSLLKFIEEPPSNTVGIFTCRNSNKVLPTIYSRCEELKSISNINEVEKYLNDNINESMHNFYLKSFFSIDEIKAFIKSKNREIIIDLYLNLKKNLYDNKKVLDYLHQFKKLSYKEIGVLINSLMIDNTIENRQALLEIASNIKFNLSKVLLFNKIINLINK
ncbi:MAG: hypothetical protein ACRCUM_01215 [Mycoplasmoidaceae bacterium]